MVSGVGGQEVFPTRDIEDRVIHDIMDVLGKALWSYFWLIYVSFRLNGQLEKIRVLV